MRDFARLLAPMARRIRLLASRAVVRMINDAGGLQGVQITLLADETRDQVERFQNYGLTSHPLPGAEGVAVSLGGSRDHLVAIVVDDRRYRLKGLAAGEVALYDDLGQVVHLKRDRILLKSAIKVEVEAPLCHMTGDLTVAGDATVTGDVSSGKTVTAALDVRDQGGAKTMAAMRSAFNTHTHTDPQGGSVGTPTPSM